MTTLDLDYKELWRCCCAAQLVVLLVHFLVLGLFLQSCLDIFSSPCSVVRIVGPRGSKIVESGVLGVDPEELRDVPLNLASCSALPVCKVLCSEPGRISTMSHCLDNVHPGELCLGAGLAVDTLNPVSQLFDDVVHGHDAVFVRNDYLLELRNLPV